MIAQHKKFSNIRKILTLVIGINLLSGCASLNSNLSEVTADAVSIPEPTNGSLGSRSKVADIVTYAQTRASQFSDISGQLKRLDLNTDESLLGMAIASAASLLYVNNTLAQHNWISGAALGGGTIAAYKGRIDAKSAATAYLDASNKLICVALNLEQISRLPDQDKTQLNSLPAEISKENDYISNLQIPDNPNNDSSTALNIAKSTSLKTRAEAIITIARNIYDSYSLATEYSKSTLLRIENNLNTSLDGKSIDYNSILNTLKSSSSTINSNAQSSALLKSIKAPDNLFNNKKIKGVKYNTAIENPYNTLLSETNHIELLTLSYPYQNIKSMVTGCISNNTGGF